jgi:hypothetical protein
MKTMWNALSFVAVVHLLGAAIFVAWLWATERLDGGRIEQIRALLAPTIPAAEAAAAAGRQEQERAEQQAREEAIRRDPPLAAAAEVLAAADAREHADASRGRIEELRVQLEAQFAAAMAGLEAQRTELYQQKRELQESAEAERLRTSDAQFRKAVKLLEGLPPRLAKQQLLQLVGEGKIDQAVAYLDAMAHRPAGKILAEFKTEPEAPLATELLERLRVLGVSPAPRDSSDVDPLASAGR